MNKSDVLDRVLLQMGRAMGTFSMLRPGDRIAVGVSGGKDSMCLVDALEAYRRRAPFDYELIGITVEQGKFTSSVSRFEEVMSKIGVRWMLREDSRTLTLVADNVAHGCDVCSRNRRGLLYKVATELGCNVLALGHTADDCAESLLRNILFNGRIASLPPVSDSRKGTIRIVRPLVFVAEALTSEYAIRRGLATVGCACSDKKGPRSEIRAFMDEMKKRHHGIPDSVTAALANVNPYTLFDQELRKTGSDVPAFSV